MGSTRFWRWTAMVGLLVGATGCTSGASERGADTTASTAAAVASAEGAADPGGPVGPAEQACTEVDPATWRVPPTDVDLVAAVTAGEVPGPVGSADEGAPSSAAAYPTPDAFLAQSNVPDPAGREAVMEEAGYDGGVEAQFLGVDPTNEVQVLSFADGRGATAYLEAHLVTACRIAPPTVQALSDDGGIAFVDPVGAGHALFAFGDAEVSLSLCACAGADQIGLLQAWYRTWVEELATGAAILPV